MNFIFFGTPEFAGIILEKLINAGFVPAAVICNPDRPVGRKQIITPPPTKLLIANYKLQIPVLQPENLGEGFISEISNLKPDFCILAAYARIIPREILEIPKRGIIGIHPSLLPKYRGASPIQTAVLEGEFLTGTTLFLMDEKMDHGPIIANSKYQIVNSDNYESLNKKLAELGGDLMIETLPKFLAGEITPLLQDEAQATYTKKFKTEDAFIKPEDLEEAENSGGEIAKILDRKIRAYTPEPGAFTLRSSKGESRRMKILEAIITSEGKLKLLKIQYEGKKPQEVK